MKYTLIKVDDKQEFDNVKEHYENPVHIGKGMDSTWKFLKSSDCVIEAVDLGVIGI